MVNTYDYKEWFTEKESIDKALKSDEEKVADLLPPEGDKKVEEGKEIKILTLKNILTRPPVLLAQIKTGNNSCKLKNESDK